MQLRCQLECSPSDEKDWGKLSVIMRCGITRSVRRNGKKATSAPCDSLRVIRITIIAFSCTPLSSCSCESENKVLDNVLLLLLCHDRTAYVAYISKWPGDLLLTNYNSNESMRCFMFILILDFYKNLGFFKKFIQISLTTCFLLRCKPMRPRLI